MKHTKTTLYFKFIHFAKFTKINRIREEYSKLNELAKSIPGNVRRADLRDRMHVALSLTAVVPLGITGQRVKALLAKCNAPEVINKMCFVRQLRTCHSYYGMHVHIHRKL